MASKGTILITGINGYLAGRAAVAALKTGYSVRGTARNPASADKLKEVFSELGYADKFEVVQVSDITKPGAFDDAVVGVTSILHLASPTSAVWTTPPLTVLKDAVDGTQSILDSTAKAGPQLRSFVYMSSTAAMFADPPEPRIHNESDWNTVSVKILEEQGNEAPLIHSYCSSKTAAEQAVWKFREETKPAFSVTTAQGSWIIGPPMVPWETREQIHGSTSSIWKVVAGEDIPEPSLPADDTVDVRDMARVLLWAALNPDNADGERFLCSSASGGGQAVADILSRRMPHLAIKKGTPGQGYNPDYTPLEGRTAFDGSKTLKATGQDWIPYETSVVDMAEFFQRYL